MAAPADTAVTTEQSVTQKIESFIRGIQFRDTKLVEEALKSNVRPDTPVGGRFNPLYYLLASSYENDSQDVQQSVTPEDYARGTARIIDLLFEHGAKVAEPEKYESRAYKTLMDTLVLSDNTVDASTVLLHAIVETAPTGKVYQPDLAATAAAIIAGNAGDPDFEPKDGVRTVINKLEQLHNLAQQRLANPQTAVEKAAADIIARDKDSPYRTEYQRPQVSVVLKEIFPDGIPEDEKEREAVLRSAFRRKSGGPSSKYLTQIDRQEPAAVLAALKEKVVGFDAQKDDAQSLIFSRQVDAAFADAGAGTKPPANMGEVIIGEQGVGKTEFARQKANLLVSLGLAGPNYVEFTKENSAGPSETLPLPQLAKLFAKADIIHIELADIEYNQRNPYADFTLRMIAALKAAQEERKEAGVTKDPVVLMTGTPQLVKEVLDSNPTLKAMLPNYTRLPEPGPKLLNKMLDHIAAKEGYVLDDGAKQEAEKAFEAIRKELGRDFDNGRGITRLVGAFKGAIGKRLFGPGSEGNPKPSLDQLRTVTAADMKSLNLYQLLAGPEIAKKQRIGFGAPLRYN